MKKSLGALITVGVLGGFVSGYDASALTYQNNVDVQFTFNPVIRIDLSDSELLITNLAPGAASDSNIITVSAATNASHGYQLSATVGAKGGTDALINSLDNTRTFENLDTSKTELAGFDDNTWGYSYCADTAANCGASGVASWVNGSIGGTTAGYGGLPLDDNDDASLRGQGGVTLMNTTGDSDNGNVVQFKIGAKAGTNQVAGTYSNTINFYAVANPAPEPPLGPEPISQCTTAVPGVVYMQDITSENYATVLNSMEKNAQYYLRDKRDGIPYCVSRIDDGTTDGTIWMTQNLRITGTVSSSGSNFSTYSSVDVCEGGDLTTGNTYDFPRCHDSGNATNGVWYNFAAASAKTIMGSSNTAEAIEDICPAGWHLPNYDTTKPAGSVDSLVDISSAGVTAFSPVTGGYYFGGTINSAGYGYWWSSTASVSSNRYYLYYGGSSLNTRYGTRYSGMYIRCTR